MAHGPHFGRLLHEDGEIVAKFLSQRTPRPRFGKQCISQWLIAEVVHPMFFRGDKIDYRTKSEIKLVYGAVGIVGLGALCSTLVSVISVWWRCHVGVGRSTAARVFHLLNFA